MSFIATANPPVVGTEQPVDNHPWFPAISPDELRQACRLDGTVTPARLRLAIVSALDSVNSELHAWRLAHQAAGHASLAAVPCEELSGTSANVGRYYRAVYAHVQAELAEVYRDIDTTPASDSKGDRIKDRIEAKIEEHRRTLRWAITDLLGLRRTTVELI